MTASLAINVQLEDLIYIDRVSHDAMLLIYRLFFITPPAKLMSLNFREEIIMTMTLLNLDTAAEMAARYFVNESPVPPLKHVDYRKIANAVLRETASKIEQKMLNQKILVFAGIEWDIYTTEDFEDQLRSDFNDYLIPIG